MYACILINPVKTSPNLLRKIIYTYLLILVRLAPKTSEHFISIKHAICQKTFMP